ncbi:hypothetical protein [Edaphocola flava]|uniref:hypothetical protein n=1 Tax=Edaphocola flava TaxID=2499629 RepID=UPI00100C2F38|nr:hypothetical protein [Edaphocola flava]
MDQNLNHEVLKVLEDNGIFRANKPVMGGYIISFKDNLINVTVGPNIYKYQISELLDSDEYINIIPKDPTFTKNIKVEIEYLKPVYIRRDSSMLHIDGYIILK